MLDRTCNAFFTTRAVAEIRHDGTQCKEICVLSMILEKTIREECSSTNKLRMF
jgi:hypothetical protein